MSTSNDLEKQPLNATYVIHATVSAQEPTRPRWNLLPFLIRFTIFYFLLHLILIDPALPRLKRHYDDYQREPLHRHDESTTSCQQFKAIKPLVNELLDANKAIIFSQEYEDYSVNVMRESVKIHTESFDTMGPVGEDPRWNVFYTFAEYLQNTFPEVHDKLSLVKINTHGLVYTWTGSDASLKPILLMAHQDTVPVNPETIGEWTHPPWEGTFDGEYLWGRGSSDCKNTLTALLESVTLLIKANFQPERTILLAFGFDEESKGYQGAGHIAPYLNEIYGDDGIMMILDEGGLGVGEKYDKGTIFALPSTGEKGYLDVNFTLHTTGGHSSVPPPHTGIGIIAEAITSLESSPYTPSISLSSPIFSLVQCAAEYAPVPSSFKKSVRDSTLKGKKGEKARKMTADAVAALGPAERYLVTTSQAIDLVGGGVKVNALPETSFFVVNYRVSVDSTLQVVKDKVTKHAIKLAKKHGLDVEIFGKKSSYSHKHALSGGSLQVVILNELPPAPITSATSNEWKVLAGTIRHVYSDKYPGSDVIVAPSIMTGNTDTRFHWNNSQNIIRFSPSTTAMKDSRIHTVDERLLFSEHIQAVWFFHEFIRNFDGIRT